MQYSASWQADFSDIAEIASFHTASYAGMTILMREARFSTPC